MAPTYSQAKTIAWRYLVQQYRELPKELQRGKNESELWVEVGNGSRITLKGAENEDSLRGSKLGGLVIDEVASIKNFEYLWDEALRPALTDKQGWGLFISTPKGYNHFYKLFEKEHKDKDYKSFHFTSYDNPYLTESEIDKAKEELNDDAFAQEYLADFRKFTGLIYKEFDRGTHLVDEVPLDGYSAYYRAMDFGAVNPTACLFIKVDNDDVLYVYDEYYEREKTTDYHAGQILARYPNTYFRATFGDPSGKQEMIDYARWGLHITPANKTVLDKITGTMKAPGEQDWVNYGIEQVQQRLKTSAITKRPRLLIAKKCVNLIRELESYRWEERKDQSLNAKEVPIKADDHAPDALRYFVVSYMKPVRKQRAPDTPHSRVTGY